MKKEKWLVGEIERWQAENIIPPETAQLLKESYAPKKSNAVMIILFSVIGTLLIGMGIILIGANNWWYRLPVAIRTVIAFLPLVISQIILLYVFRYKMHSTAFRESAAILNMAGVFSSVAIVDQIFHMGNDFTDYILLCGILSCIPMFVMDAASPLIIYYWTVINGGLCLNEAWSVWFTVAFFAAGAVFAVRHFKNENGKAVYLSWITLISGFILLLTTAIMLDTDVILMLFAYCSVLLTFSQVWDKVGVPMKITGIGGSLLITALLSYEWAWDYTSDFGSVEMSIIFAVMVIAAVTYMIKKRQVNVFAAGSLGLTILRLVWMFIELNESPLIAIFTVISNLILFAAGVFFIWDGAKRISLASANTGMITVCALIVMRFFDSEMPLFARGVVFVVLGTGFLLFNLYLMKNGKKKKGEAK